MTFDALDIAPADTILGLMAAYQADPAHDKIDLTVGVYRNDAGATPVPAAVHEAERRLLDTEGTKIYLPPAGSPGFRERIADLVLGPRAGEVRERATVLQTPGGCGALRLGAELYARAGGGTVYLSTPTWGNHEALLTGAGLPITRYPYYRSAEHRLDAEGMLSALATAPAGSLVLLQASCHNPTGADLDAADRRAVLDTIAERDLVPFFDMAYQGLGDDTEADAAFVREAAARLPEMLVAVSCSKNFGLYRERTGALIAVGAGAAAKAPLESQANQIARAMYSMSPAHGALLVETVLGDAELERRWRDELAGMAARVRHLRAGLARALAQRRPDLDTTWLARQKGMFSLLGLAPETVATLRDQAHLYMVGDSRINLAGLTETNIPRVAEVLAPHLT